MKKRIALSGLGLCSVILGCGGAPPPQPASAPPPAPVAAVAPAPAPREPSAKLRRYFAAGENPRLVLYADLEDLFHTQLVEGLLPELLRMGGELSSGRKQECVKALAENARELLLADGKGGTLVLVGFKTGGLAASRSVCLGSIVSPNKATVAGAEEAYATDGGVIALMPDVVVGGFQPRVEAALASSHEKEPAGIELKPGQQLVWRSASPRDGIASRGAVNIDDQRLLIEADLDFAEEAVAAAAESRVREGKASLSAMLGGENPAPVEQLVNALVVKRDGKHLNGRFELVGTPASVAQKIGVVAALGVYGARKYIVEAKTAEARVMVQKIAASYVGYFAGPASVPAAARPKKKLESFPAVPANVPPAQKYQSTPADWTPWAPLAFSIQEPQYYQYQVVAAKDGKTAEVIAHGDLDGDGESSTFRIKLTLDPKTQTLSASPIEEQQATE